jgi:hypothetical protein
MPDADDLCMIVGQGMDKVADALDAAITTKDWDIVLKMRDMTRDIAATLVEHARQR